MRRLVDRVVCPTTRRRRMRRIAHVIAALPMAAAVLAGPLVAPPARADVGQMTVVSEDPVNWTPHVLDGSVAAIAVAESAVVVGGNFSLIQDSRSRRTFRQPFLFAFDRRSGGLSNWSPNLDGVVNAVAPGPD